MISENDKQTLTRNLLRNRVILVTGAGFSASALNISGSNLPVGSQLASALWEFLYDSPYDNRTSLKTLYGAAQTHRKGIAALREFLKSRLQVASYPSWYTNLTEFFWRRIYTFNADDLLEKIYADIKQPQLDRIVAPATYAERDAFLRKIQYIKLHGSIDDDRGLTFGPRDYGTRAAARTDIWYLHFVEDYSTLPTIFVGTELDEQLFWQYVELRGSQLPRGARVRRPKCFLVSPGISKPNEEVLSQYNIISVRSTAEDFFDWLLKQAAPLSRENVLRLVDPSLEPALTAAESGATVTDTRVIEYFFSFFRIPIRPMNPRDRAMFLLGAPPSWDDVAADVDAHREINDLIRENLRRQIAGESKAIALISSAAGGGKSTICKRIALDLIDQGYSVYFSEGETRPNPGMLSEYICLLEQRSFLFFDNAGEDLGLIAELWERIQDCAVPPVIVVAARANDVAFHRHRLAKVGAEAIELAVPHLSDHDIESILDTLDRHDLLGKLRERTHEERVEVFRTKARKQILVAMREATSGRGFDEIIRDEFEKIRSQEAKLLYLVVALASDGNYALTTQQMITAMELPPNETLVLIEQELAGILVQLESDANKYVSRHPAIARFIIEAAPREMLANAIVALMITISTVLSPGGERRWNRAFRVYRDILSHHRLNQMFLNRQSLVRQIYEEIKDYYRDDGHYWLQYASFELEYGGEISLAENYLAQAEGILQHSKQVETATAHLLFKKAIAAQNSTIAESLMQEAAAILRGHMADRSNVSPHALHIFGRQMWLYVWRWIPTIDRSEYFSAVYDELRRAIPDHLRSHPELVEVLEQLKRAELETVIRPSSSI